jgi:heat shock protein HtpX
MNVIRILSLFSLLAAVIIAAGWLAAGFWGMTAALLIVIAISMASYWYSDSIVLRMYGAVPANDNELDEIAEKLASQACIPKPRVFIIPADVPNAFATGRDYEHSVIALTKGLLAFEKYEIEAVMAHEMGHIKHRDTLGAAVAAAMAAAVAYVAQIGYWSLFMEDRKSEGGFIGLVLIIIFAPVAALIIRFAISRLTEYRADYVAAMLTRNPRALSGALMKINEIAMQAPVRGPAATSNIWIVNPFHVDWFTALFSTHPPVEMRIKRLESMNSIGYEPVEKEEPQTQGDAKT